MAKQTKAEVERAFRADLKVLLTKYQAEVEVEPEYDWDALEITIPAIYNDQHKCEREYTVVRFNRYFTYENVDERY